MQPQAQHPTEMQQPMAQQPPPPPADVYTTQQEPEMWYDRLGFGLALGGGVDDFVSDDYRSATNIGGGWNLRATVGTRFPVAFEGSYFGSAQSINALGLDDDAVLVGNGLEGAARINVLSGYEIQPFVYGGAAWRHYDLTNEGINTSDIQDSDDVFEVPVGVGVAGYIAGFMADVRAEYRGVWDADLIPFANDNGAVIGEADRWSVAGTLGMSF